MSDDLKSDRDADGVLSPEEFAALVEEQAQRYLGMTTVEFIDSVRRGVLPDHPATAHLLILTGARTASDAMAEVTMTPDEVCYRRIKQLETLADVLAEELKRWGWGDMHYGSQPQEKSVTDALSVYQRVRHVGRDAP
jgi:hypothetical protein